MTGTVLLVAAALLGGCTDASRSTAPPPASTPPATAQVGRTTTQLGYGSFRWAGSVANFGPPSRRTDLPRIVVRRGRTVTFRLRFDPDRLTVRVGGGRATALRAEEVAGWRASRGGLLVLRGEVGGDYATYLARVVVR